MTTAIVRAARALAGRTIVALEAVALTSLAVADTLVGALHVIVRRVRPNIILSVSHVGELFLSTERIHVGVLKHELRRPAKRVRGTVQVTLGSVDMSQAKRTSALGAIGTLPVAVAFAHVIVCAVTVTRASVRAFGRYTREGEGKSYKAEHGQRRSAGGP